MHNFCKFFLIVDKYSFLCLTCTFFFKRDALKLYELQTLQNLDSHLHSVWTYSVWSQTVQLQISGEPLLQTECLCPPKFIWWSLISSVIEFGDEAYERWLGHKGGAFLNEVSALTDHSVAPSTIWGHSQKVAIYESERKLSSELNHAGTLILGFRLQNCEK